MGAAARRQNALLSSAAGSGRLSYQRLDVCDVKQRHGTHCGVEPPLAQGHERLDVGGVQHR